MRVVVITQEDPFFIPRNIELLCRDPELSVSDIVVLDTKGALANMRWRLLRWFGPVAIARLALRNAQRLAAGAVDRVRGGRPHRPFSIRAVARAHGVSIRRERDANDARLLDYLERRAPDVIVSYSAPQVFNERLLRVPRYGCINLHCSLLPSYRGLLPSFWVLRHQEPVSGATVHFMAAGIDDGDIVAQERVDIANARTMYEVLDATKEVGGRLMLEALHGIRQGVIVPVPNRTAEGSYFSWPADADIRQFHRLGYRLV